MMRIFGAAEVLNDLGRNRHLGELVSVAGDLVTVDEQHGGQNNLALVVCDDAVHRNDRANLDLFLPATGAHYCEYHFSYLFFVLRDRSRVANDLLDVPVHVP